MNGELEQSLKTSPTISVIIPVYNTEMYLRRCIDSVLTQSYKDFELLLIDDGSKDSSGTICDEYAAMDSRFRVIHKENGGLTSARNAGLAIASGDWIMHLDGDDWIEPDMLERLIRKGEDTGAEIVMGDFLFAYPDRDIRYRFPDWDNNKTASLNRYITSVWTCVWGGIHKRSLYEEYQMICPQGVTYCEDFHLMARLCYYAKKVVNIHQPFYHYRQQEGSVMHNLNKRTERDEQWVYQDIIRFFKEQGVYDDYRKRVCWRMLKATQELVLDKSTWKAFQEMVPEKKHYIWDCPYINRKLKMNMWCLTHHLSWISQLMLNLRKLRHGRI